MPLFGSVRIEDGCGVSTLVCTEFAFGKPVLKAKDWIAPVEKLAARSAPGRLRSTATGSALGCRPKRSHGR